MTLHWAVIDTSVYVEHWQGRLALERLEVLRRAFVVRHSAVVLSELRRGARTAEARKQVVALYRLAVAPWAPTADDWWVAGDIVRTIGDRQGWDVSKRRSFQNDALIALAARHHGATVVTLDRGDFDLLAGRLGISVRTP